MNFIVYAASLQLAQAMQSQLAKIGVKIEIVTYLRKEALHQSHRTIQMVFQDPAAVFSPRMKVSAFLAEPLLNFNRADVQKETVRLLEQVTNPFIEISSR